MMEPLRAAERHFPCILFLALVLGTSAVWTGCGGGQSQQAVGLPTPPPAGLVNSYVGGQGSSPSESSLLSVTIDHSKNAYSYGPVGTTTPTAGAFSTLTGGFLILLNQSGYQSGLALEVPGEATILRPGDVTTPLIFAVQQATCFAIGGNVKFLFASSPGLPIVDEAAYGRIYASTNSSGNSWQFNNLTEYQEPDGSIPANADFPGYPSGYPGTCSASNGSASTSAAPLSYFPDGTTYPLPTQFVINPGGFFFENQSYVNVAAQEGWPYPSISAWGVSEPPTSLATGYVTSFYYVGFLMAANISSGVYETQLVGFGNAPAAGTTMTGGTFANDDPTQSVTVNMSVTFGTEDTLNNGLYYLATLSIPYDAQSTCSFPVLNANGVLTCTYDAVATVSQPNGQFAIILSAFDSSGNQKTLVLFQQPPPLTLACPASTTTLGGAYSSAFVASGGTPPYVDFALSVGTLPPGLALNSSSGAITGSPTTSGTYTFVGSVSDSYPTTALSHACVISVATPPQGTAESK